MCVCIITQSLSERVGRLYTAQTLSERLNCCKIITENFGPVMIELKVASLSNLRLISIQHWSNIFNTLYAFGYGIYEFLGKRTIYFFFFEFSTFLGDFEEIQTLIFRPLPDPCVFVFLIGQTVF